MEQDWCWGAFWEEERPLFCALNSAELTIPLPPTGHGLPSLFPPLSFKLRFAMRLPQDLRPVPHRQHNAETYDRTDHSESEAIIYRLGIHFFATVTSVSILFGTSTQTTD